MDISSLDTAKLKSLLKLTEVRDAIKAELQKIEEAIASVFSGQNTSTGEGAPKPGKRRGRKPGRRSAEAVGAAAGEPSAASAKVAQAGSVKKISKKGGRRGAIKDQILAILKEAGSKGASVKDISAQLGVKPQNVHVWFSTTGKTAGLKKIAPGVYRLK